ncbi:hypothetical protein OEZ85_002545 [Tetradesmus obliquus]|uniref:Choline kinase N-terminal domain-containing protein n=1 Tax=Tetradesmus obliquus TaxID=3088 RepID=A0ABY8U0G5_TETOB|nr:hypothetical protein OEZ85_002545 [Tetradesmus obliquus]
MAVSCEPHAATLILNQLKQEVAELKVACKLASQPNSSSAQSLQSLEREAQLARKQYDGLLEQRRKQAAELERIFAEWQQLEAGTAAQVQDSPAQRRAQQLQAQLADASAHLAEALYTQQQYTDVVQQLKQGHADFERQLEQLRSQLAGQQQLIAKTKAHLLQCTSSPVMEEGHMAAPPATASDTFVDVPLLVDRPKAALLGVLKLLEGWESATEENITVEQFSGAMTNLVYRCGLQEGGKETQLVLMRVHASASDLFDRAAEVATFQSVSAAGLGPRLLLLFGNGRVEQFLAQHVTLAAADLHEPAVSEAIAHTVANFHSRMSEALAGDEHHQGPVQLWGRLQAWQRLAQEHCSGEELQQMGMAGLEDEIMQLQQALCAAHPCWPSASFTSSDGLVRGHSIDSLPSEVTDFSGIALAGSSPTPSVASLPAKMHESGSATSLNLRGRSPANMQLPDGSLVLPGMKARPRGQSPERGKRPDSFPNALGAPPGLDALRMQHAGGGGSIAAEDRTASAASIGSQASLGAAAVAAAGLQPPSAAAVLRHSSSAGELFVSAGIPGAAGAGAAAAAAEAQGRVHRRGRISTSGLDTSESAEDSEDADAILPQPTHISAGSPTAAVAAAAEDVPGSRNRASAAAAAAVERWPVLEGRSEVSQDAAAAAAKGASYYRRLRRERRQPAAGIEFPTFRGSDVDSSSGSSSDYGSSSDSEAAAAATATDAPAEADASQPALLTLIDYEYSGFNPVAFDIANHWCEWAADYHTQEPHVLDFDKVPDEQQRRAFVEAYLRALLEGLGITIAEGQAALGHASASVRFVGGLGGDAALGGGLRLGMRGAGGSSVGGSIQDDLDDRESVGDGTSLWSMMSSRGGSVLSMLVDTDAATYADSTAWETCSETASQCSSKGGGWQQQQQHLAAEAVKSPSAASATAAAGAAAAELRSVWSWLELHQPDRRLLANTRQLDVACFSRLVSSLMAASGAYMACSHLLWALWGVIQSKISDVDFDFEGYGQQRWQQYLLTRPAGLQRR